MASACQLPHQRLAAPPPANIEHKNDPVEAGQGHRRYHSTNLPFRTRAISNSHLLSSAGTMGSKHHSMSIQGRADNNSSRNRHFESNPSYEGNGYMDKLSRLCEVGDCYNNVLPEATHCRSHKCHTDTCDNVRITGSRYCSMHKCQSCSKRARTESNYCSTHKCSISSCIWGKKKDTDRCKHHVCRRRKCTRAPEQGSMYCLDHTCAAEDCAIRVFHAGGWVGKYCRCHTCYQDGCLLRVSSTGRAFCDEHECTTPNCPNTRVWDDERGLGRRHECCRFHTCVQRGCFAPTAKIGVLCRFHSLVDRGHEVIADSFVSSGLHSCVNFGECYCAAPALPPGHHRHRTSKVCRWEDVSNEDEELRLQSVGGITT